MQCPVARALDQIGDAWSLLIIRTAFAGGRFFQDCEARTGIPTSTVARRLDLLCQHAVLERKRVHDRPPRDEYLLTEKGLELLPLLLLLSTWGNKWLAPEGALIRSVDSKTGEP